MSRLRLLVVDAYDAPGRAEIVAAGVTEAGVLYRKAIGHCDADADIEIFRFGDGTRPSLNGWDGVLWTGSSLTIHKPDDTVRDQINLCRAFFAQGTPQFGSCWAIQLAAVAAGGSCGPNPRGREFGVARKITLNDAGASHPLHRGRPRAFDSYTIHADMVTGLPDGAVLLSGNPFTEVQSLAVPYLAGTFWAVQYHPEYNLAEIARLAECRRTPLIAQGTFEDDAAVDRFSAAARILHEDPGRTDLAWRLGVDDDVLDADRRLTELRNWLATLPVAARR
ncbi:MAG: type 1 glutamine amidotransferase [Alphaproteobacteria bacterium]